jgi:threonylcarbamoyladenosine tRNA methylthiotransferase MtaB
MKVFFDTVGCRLNQAEIEHMAGQFRSAGHEILESAVGADLVVVNTCAVTAAASSDSRQKVRQARHAGVEKIVLTGCWATLEPQSAAELPGVSDVISNLEKHNLPLRILAVESLEFDQEPITRRPLPGSHLRTRAFIKAQDGCDNLCTFCVTRVARGKSHSLSKEAVLNEIKIAEDGGVHEVVLSGVHLASWGRDAGENETITDLITFLLDNTKVERVRLSSVEPWDLDERFLDLWQNPRMCRHFHFPLQSGSAGVLKRMLRRTTPTDFARLVENTRERIQDVAVTTDIIVGFPGETDEEFSESLDFIRQMRFSGGHVFKYSPREGTAAARMKERVHGPIAKMRADRMRKELETGEIEYYNQMVGTRAQVLWEASGVETTMGWELQGLTDNYLRVKSLASENRWNRLDQVLIESLEGKTLRGKILG